MNPNRARKERPFLIAFTDWVYGHKLLAAGLILALILALWLWPVNFVSIDSEAIEHIDLFDGNTGASATITDSDEIEQIVASVQSVPMRRTLDMNVFAGRLGFGMMMHIKMKGTDKVHTLEFCYGGKSLIAGFKYDAYWGQLPYDRLKALCPKESQ